MKNSIKLLMALIFVLSLTNCKKIKEPKKTVINLSILNSITKEGSLYANVPFKLVKNTYKGSVYSYPKKSEIIYEGKTNSEGKATIEFKRVINHKKVKYYLYVDFDVYGLSADQYKKDTVAHIAQDKINNVVFYVGEPVNFIKHIKNTNCFDANDKANYRIGLGIYTGSRYNLSDYEYNGCINEANNQYIIEDYYPYTLSVTRNGQKTVIKDTFKIEQGMDTLKWYY